MHESPLKSYHLDHGATMTEFAGWEMPLHYGSVVEEHKQCRRSGSIFDVSHMGRISLKGVHARRLLERCCTRRVRDLEPKRCRYSLVCNAAGGVIDDVLIYRMDDDEFMVVANAANRLKVLAHLEAVRAENNWKATLDDRTDKTAMVAIQGSGVMELIGSVSREIPSLERYQFAIKNLVIMKLTVSRTGYTGEDGVEVILPSGMVSMALKLLLKDVNTQDAEAALRPAGLGARDTLRIEAGLPLYGHELGEDIPASEAGLDFAISLDKSAEADGEMFIGQEALMAARDNGGPTRRLVGIVAEGQRCPRAGMAVAVDAAAEAGVVTSGTVSPTLDRPIAMAYVPASALPGGFATRRTKGEAGLVTDAGEGSAGPGVVIDPDGSKIAGRIVPLPFYRR